ncbi:MAG: GNAT family N-acetyltransferase [bacterium]
MPKLNIRPLQADDVSQLDELLHKVGIFHPFEIIVAMELIHEALKGSDDYHILIAEWLPSESRLLAPDSTSTPPDSRLLTPESRFKKPVVGYVCYGHNPMTDSLYDLYWIAVHPKAQGAGVGRALIAHIEDEVRKAKGRGIILETSGRAEYEPAKKLYLACGYTLAAEIPDFYKPGDPRLIFLKLL